MKRGLVEMNREERFPGAGSASRLRAATEPHGQDLARLALLAFGMEVVARRYRRLRHTIQSDWTLRHDTGLCGETGVAAGGFRQNKAFAGLGGAVPLAIGHAAVANVESATAPNSSSWSAPAAPAVGGLRTYGGDHAQPPPRRAGGSVRRFGNCRRGWLGSSRRVACDRRIVTGRDTGTGTLRTGTGRAMQC